MIKKSFDLSIVKKTKGKIEVNFDEITKISPYIKEETNNMAYATISIECPCEPWRYSLMDSVRSIAVSGSQVTNLVITNNGLKTLTPEIAVTGSVNITYNGSTVSLVAGTYKISDLRLYQGVNIVGVSGEGSVTFTYKEAII